MLKIEIGLRVEILDMKIVERHKVSELDCYSLRAKKSWLVQSKLELTVKMQMSGNDRIR